MVSFEEQQDNHETTITTLNHRKDKLLKRFQSGAAKLITQMNEPECPTHVFENYRRLKATIKQLEVDQG